MAFAEGVSEDVRKYAWVISPLTVAFLTPAELQLRCQYAAHLVGLAELSDESEGKRLRRDAKKYLTALSLRQMASVEADLQERISEAVRDGDDRMAMFLRDRLNDLPRDNPQVPDDWLKDIELAQAVRSAEGIKSKFTATGPRWLSWFKRSNR
jgi:hypothetical protein